MSLRLYVCLHSDYFEIILHHAGCACRAFFGDNDKFGDIDRVRIGVDIVFLYVVADVIDEASGGINLHRSANNRE